MINILYTVLLFNALIIFFKLFQKYKVNTLQALIINYATAAICSFFYINNKIYLQQIISSEWIYHAVLIGLLFIITFYFFAYGIQKIGISTTTIANKMSLIIPVAVSLILYPDDALTIPKATAFILSIYGIYLCSTESGKIKFNTKYLWIILFN